MSYTYPKWLAKTGEPIYWAYALSGERYVNKGKVLAHRAGRVYIVGSHYGLWLTPSTIEQIHGAEEGDRLPEKVGS